MLLGFCSIFGALHVFSLVGHTSKDNNLYLYLAFCYIREFLIVWVTFVLLAAICKHDGICIFADDSSFLDDHSFIYFGLIVIIR